MRRGLIALTPLLAVPLLLAADAQGGKNLLASSEPKPTSPEVVAKRTLGTVQVEIRPGENGYPGVGFAPVAGSWDLSKFGHVEATLFNPGPKPITLSLRVDNAGDWKDNPWNTESLTLNPNQEATLRTTFGYQYGGQKGFKLDSAKVANVLVFTTKSEEARAFEIRSLQASGEAGERPPLPPDQVRTPLRGPVPDARYEGSQGMRVFDRIAIFPEKADDGVFRIRPKEGRWDLRNASELWVTLQNVTKQPVTPKVWLETDGGWSRVVTGAPIPPGKSGRVAVPFGRPIVIDEKDFAPGGMSSDAVSAISVGAPAGATLGLQSVEPVSTADPVPAWLGKRPPVPGEWTQTLREEFDGTKLDPTVWKVTGENYYDKATHWTRDNVLVKGGVVRLRYSKKTGRHNDDPKRDETLYAAGYLDTFGLWAQRYGYFEARMKLPTAPGLWPAFWMMPDRGSKRGPEQWKRQDTANGGMEFDIMEHLTRWGPHRYNIAMHYDGYGADHKSPGSDKVYVAPDKDGFVTCGLLWTPGEAVFYANGREVLRWKNPRISNVPSMLMFTLPSGGWDNSPLEDARLPDDFIIDYVRVWQRKDLASPSDGKRHDPQT